MFRHSSIDLRLLILQQDEIHLQCRVPNFAFGFESE